MKQGATWGREHGRPFTDHELVVLRELSAAIDKLWGAVADDLHNRRVGYEAMLPEIWPAEDAPIQDLTHRPAELPDDYRRLKLSLDYWCSLWFWPISEYDLLPSRHQFLLEMSLILTGRPAATAGTVSWVLESELEEVETQVVRTLLDDTDNPLEVDDLTEFMSGRLDVVEVTSVEHRFLHWPLVFGDILSRQSGFGLIIGNPPWVPLHWTEKEVLAQHAPSIVLRKLSADQISQQRDSIFVTEILDSYIIDMCNGSALAAFARHPHNYPLLKGIGPNTYKLFLTQSFALISQNGTIGLLHPIDHFRDPEAEYSEMHVTVDWLCCCSSQMRAKLRCLQIFTQQ